MIQSMWFNLHVQDLEKSAQFYKALGFKINRNPQMLDKMVGIQ
ncbi:glyoxalase, partial [Staphylococcus aureus]|nr:glyoxalase [Staphylococcus aureus]